MEAQQPPAQGPAPPSHTMTEPSRPARATSGSGSGRRRRPAAVASALSLLLLLAVPLSSCLAFAPPSSLPLRRLTGSSRLPVLPSAAAAAAAGGGGRRAARMPGSGRRGEVTALALFRGKRIPVGAGVSVSLDKRAIPKGLWTEGSRAPGFIWPALGIFVVLLLMGKVPGMAAVNAAIRGFCDRHNIELYDKLAYRYRLLRGHVERLKDHLRRRWEKMNPKEVTVLPPQRFPVPLTLLERANIGGSFLKYRFAFPGPTDVIDLDLGQQVSLIGSTPEDRVMKAHFIPLSERGEPGVLEIVSEKNDPDDPAVRILDTLAIGETIQATPGARLTNRHPGPINKLLLVISKLGVVPALQFLKALLPSSGGYSVDYANVVWVNERQDQYILHEELQSLFYKYNSKLDVFTVAERDLFMGDLSANPQFRMSIPTFSADTLAIVAGPEYFTTKAVDYLRKNGYAEDVIVTL